MRLGPSVLITDLRMPKRNGIGLITHFRPVLPSMRVIIHTGCESADLLGLACDAHPAGVIHGEDGVIGLRRAFEAAIAGERYVSKAVMDRIDRQGGKRNTLTPTEISVLSMVLEEQKSSEIARRLGMSERTVGAHRESIHKKLGTHSQAALLKWAMRNGLME